MYQKYWTYRVGTDKEGSIGPLLGILGRDMDNFFGLLLITVAAAVIVVVIIILGLLSSFT